MGREVPRRRAGRDRRPLAGVPVRARPREDPVRPRRRWASTTRSRSTTTSRSGGPSTTRTGPPSTSSTPRDGSGITTSARRTTSGRSGSSSSCSPRREATVSTEDLVSVEPDGVYLAADWDTLGSPETYVGYARATGFASPGGLATRPQPGLRRAAAASRSTSGRSPATGRSGPQITTLNEPGGRIVHRFHGRDLNLVLGTRADGAPVRFRVLIDGQPPIGARGLDVDEQGDGTVVRGAALPADPPGRSDHRPHLRDHLPRRGRPGLRVHVRLVVERR